MPSREDDFFFNRNDLDQSRIQRIVDDTLHGGDDGELYFEYCQSEGFVFDDGRLKNASFDTTQASACAVLPERRRALPIHQNSRKLQSSAPQTPWLPSNQDTRAFGLKIRAEPMSHFIPMTTRSTA